RTSVIERADSRDGRTGAAGSTERRPAHRQAGGRQVADTCLSSRPKGRGRAQFSSAPGRQDCSGSCPISGSSAGGSPSAAVAVGRCRLLLGRGVLLGVLTRVLVARGCLAGGCRITGAGLGLAEHGFGLVLLHRVLDGGFGPGLEVLPVRIMGGGDVLGDRVG